MNSQTSSDRPDKNLFFAALDLPSMDERAAFIKTVCARDPSQRKRLEALLESHFRKGQFMAQPAAPAEEPLLTTGSDEVIGSQIGRFKLLEKLGEGGFGTVYVAEQTVPVRRRVALKIIKLGMDTRQVVARFEAEQQALAMMEHPNIANVFDAGATDAGRPYFVMELVRGASITNFCEQNELGTEERLRLFAQVCRGMEHAHQKGIIHRDLKPSNILVTLHDGRPVPKIIDFGIAKATQGDLTDETIYTEFHQLIGTPAYMSPEQAEMSGLGVDTRTDIYALGVLLYELLVGKTPFDGKDLIRSGVDEMRRTIREKEPQRPSTRLSRDPTLRPKITTDQRKKFAGHLRGDLDWIVMKCLEKDRTRRYATAHELTADLQRYLDNKAVLARPPTVAYQFQKAWRRRKLAISGVALIAAILLAATGVSLWLAIEATAARKQAWRSQQTESQERRRADAQKSEAERNLYAANMSLVPQAFEQNDFIRVAQLLKATESAPNRGFEWRYWRRQTHESLQVFRGHAMAVRAVAFSPDGQKLVTAAEDNLAKIWDVQTGAELLTFDKHPDFLVSVAWSSDGQFIVSSSIHQIRGWNPETGQEIFTIANASARVGVIALSYDDGRIVAGFGDGTACIFRTKDQKTLLEMRGNAKGVRSAAFSPDGRLVAFGGVNPICRVFDSATGAQVSEFRGHRDSEWVRSLAFSPDSRQIVSASDDQTAKVWEAATGRELFSLNSHGYYVVGAAFSPDGARIATASFDWTAKLWNAGEGKELATLKGHAKDATFVAFSRDGARLATASDDQTAIVWNLNRDEGRIPLWTHKRLAMALSSDCRLAAVAAGDESIRILKMDSGQEWKRLAARGAPPSFLAFSEDGRELVSARLDRTVIIWNLETGRPLPLQPREESDVSVAAFLRGGRLATGGKDGMLRIWDLASGRLLAKTDCGSSTTSIAASPDGRLIGMGFLDKRVMVADAQTLALRQIGFHEAGVGAIAFSLDGTRLASGSGDRTARVWDTETGREELVLSGHGGAICSVEFSADRHRLVTSSDDNTACVWNADDGRQLLSLPGTVRSARFGPDGLRIAAIGAQDLRVWRAASDAEMAQWERREMEGLARATLARTNFNKAWQAKLEAQSTDPGAIRAWKILGPLSLLPNEDGAEAVRRVFVPIEGKESLDPEDSISVDGQTLRWRPLTLKDHTIDFIVGLNPAKLTGVAYAFCVIQSDRDRDDLRMLVGSDDQSRVYLNGTLIHESLQSRGFQADEDLIEDVSLRAGKNALLFKVVNESSQWMGSIRLTDREGRPPQGIRFGN